MDETPLLPLLIETRQASESNIEACISLTLEPRDPTLFVCSFERSQRPAR